MKRSFQLGLYVLLFPFSIFPAVGHGQSFLTEDTLLAKKNMLLGRALVDSAQYGSALELFQSAENLYRPHTLANDDTVLWRKYLTIHIDLGRTRLELGKHQEGLQRLQDILPFALEKIGERHIVIARMQACIGDFLDKLGEYQLALDKLESAFTLIHKYHPKRISDLFVIYNSMGTIYHNLAKYDTAKSFFLKAINMLDVSNPQSLSNLSASYQNLGLIYDEMGQYDSALFHYKKALDIEKQIHGDNHLGSAQIYNNMGVVFGILEAYERALEHFQQGLNIFLQFHEKYHPTIAQYYNNIGMVHSFTGDQQAALNNFSQALTITSRNLGPKHPAIAGNYHNIAMAYDKMGDYDNGIHFYKKALNIFLQTLGENHPRVSRIYHNLGNVYEDKGEFETSEMYFLKDLNILPIIYGETHPEVAWSYKNLGELYQKAGRYQEALEAFQQAMNANSLEFKEDDIAINPDIDVQILSVPLFMRCLRRKAQTFLDLHKAEGRPDSPHLNLAYETYQRSLQLLSKIRKGFLRDEDQAHILHNSIHMYDEYIQTAEILWNQTHDKRFLDQMFQASEQQKSIRLVESIQTMKARLFLSIPTDLLELERRLQLEKVELVKTIAEQQSQLFSQDSTLIARKQMELFATGARLDSVKHELETHYHEYYRLNYGQDIPSMSEVQDFLTDSTALIEYFMGENDLYSFVITPDTVLVHRQALNSLSQDIFTFRQGLSQPERSFSDQGRYADYDSFSQQAHQLFQLLLAQALDSLSDIRTLIIIPDGPLGYIPFDLLLDEQASLHSKEKLDYGALPFLLKSYQVRYEFSSTLLLVQPQNERSYNNSYLGIAPAYGSADPLVGEHVRLRSLMDQTRSSFSPLMHNQAEVSKVSSLWKGNVLLGKEANLEAFHEAAQGNQILHLAMHAFVHDSLPLLSGFVFSPSEDSGKENVLYSYELYNQQLEAELAILSACETGYGQIQRGEGIMSLARAFKYAGCPNILMTLWTADDRASGEIVADFSRYLKAGMQKDEALRLAKLDYLRNGSKKHPYYWANFVLVGDNAPLLEQKSTNAYFFCMFVLMSLTAGGIYFWRKNASQA